MDKSPDINYQTAAFIGILVALISVSSFIRIPTPIMPITMQVFIILLSPITVGTIPSFTAILIYIALGLTGLPIFSNGGGPAYILQPSFGFLIGFLISPITAYIFIKKADKSFKYIIAAGIVELLTIHISGIIGFWLNMNIYQGKAISLINAIMLFSAPFILPDILKLIGALITAYKIRTLIKKLN